jgi:hypothetical protein
MLPGELFPMRTLLLVLPTGPLRGSRAPGGGGGGGGGGLDPGGGGGPGEYGKRPPPEECSLVLVLIDGKILDLDCIGTENASTASCTKRSTLNTAVVQAIFLFPCVFGFSMEAPDCVILSLFGTAVLHLTFKGAWQCQRRERESLIL